MQNTEQFYRQIGAFDESTLNRLEKSGLRMTVQRRHIIEILFRSQYTTPKEVWYEAKRFIPDLGIATVYRLINRLEQIGVLAKARNIGMAKVEPKLGGIADSNGHTVSADRRVTLNELIRAGLISYGVIGQNNKIDLSLVGDKVNVTVVS